MKKNFLLVFILFLYSCEPDDICLSTIADTPKMIIVFYDHSSGQKKEVQNLQIKGSENSSVYFEKTTDSIALPLKNLEKITGYSLTNNYSDNFNQLLNTDDILINYEYNYVFVSRACGYVSNYNLKQIVVENDNLNWIIRSEIINTEVFDEKNIHVKIYH